MDINCLKHKINRLRNWNGEYYSQASVHCKKCLFIHIPKTGGVSVAKAIYGNLGLGHRSINWSKKKLGDIHDYYIFTIVREPISRFLSAVNYLLEGGRNYDHINWKNKYFDSDTTINTFIANNLSSLLENDIHFKPQASFLLNGEKIDSIINDVFRFENFREVEKMVVLNYKKKIQQINSTKSKRFTINDLSKDSVGLLKEAYAEDYKLLSYNLF